MFWDWLFRKKRKDHMDNDPQMLGTRVWLQELREICERHFDNRACLLYTSDAADDL